MFFYFSGFIINISQVDIVFSALIGLRLATCTIISLVTCSMETLAGDGSDTWQAGKRCHFLSVWGPRC